MERYSLSEAARILSLSPTRLRYWQRTALIPASGTDSGQPTFDFRDLICIRAVVALLEHGVPLRRIRRSAEAIRARVPEADHPLDALRIWVDGSERVVVRHEGSLLEPDGQLVLDFQLDPEGAEEVERLRPALPEREGAPDFERALEQFEIGCRLDSEPARYAEAIEAYRAAVEADPGFSDAWCNLGTVYYNRSDRETARRCYEAAVGYEPTHVEANFNLANLLEELGEDESALRHYRLALAVDPCYADLHLNLALLQEKLGRHPKAREHWQRYVELSPKGTWAEVARQRLKSGD